MDIPVSAPKLLLLKFLRKFSTYLNISSKQYGSLTDRQTVTLPNENYFTMAFPTTATSNSDMNRISSCTYTVKFVERI